MKINLNRQLTIPLLVLLPLLLVPGLAFAGSEHAMLIDIDTDDFQIEQMDISHLEPGDTETIYTDDGRAVDILRTEQGIEIFVDGEKLNLPSFAHPDHSVSGDHENHKVMVKIICESDEAENCADEHHRIVSDHTDGDHGDAHEVIIIKKVEEQEDEI